MELPTKVSIRDTIHAGVPSSEALREVMQQLRTALADVPAIQEQLLSLDGEAWSPDGTVRVRVGPRGQLVDIEIDPKVFRRPDSSALRETILAANQAAVRTVVERAQQLMADYLPTAELAELRARFDPSPDDPVERTFGIDAAAAPPRRRP